MPCLDYNSTLIGEISCPGHVSVSDSVTPQPGGSSDSSSPSICEEDPESSPRNLSGRRLAGKLVSFRVEIAQANPSNDSPSSSDATLHDSARARQCQQSHPAATVQYSLSLSHEPSPSPPLALALSAAATRSASSAASSSSSAAPPAPPPASRLPANRRRRPLLRSATAPAAAASTAAAAAATAVATTHPHAKQHRRAQWP